MDCVFVFQYSNEEWRTENAHHILCNSNASTIPFTRLSTLLKYPLINLPKTWIEFKIVNIKNFWNKIEFKIKLKQHLLGELSSVITCGRLLCPSCHLNAGSSLSCNILYIFNLYFVPFNQLSTTPCSRFFLFLFLLLFLLLFLYKCCLYFCRPWCLLPTPTSRM